MSTITLVILLPWAAGLTAFLGGALASLRADSVPRPLRQTFSHGMVAFGGGVLFAAITFALLPEALSQLHVLPLAATFVAGGVIFAFIDKRIAASHGVGAQFVAMLVDFVPEAISLGAVFGHDHRLGYLLAGFIGLQNAPEGFNAYREMVSSGANGRSTLLLLLAVSILGPIAAILGYTTLQNIEPITAGIMSFAAGGILFLVFQDIAIQARLDGQVTPAMGSVFGFTVGMVGNELIGTLL